MDAGGTVTRLGRAVYAWEPVSDAVLHADWKVVASAAWQYKEGMPVLEGRALLVGVRHTLRRSATFGCRVLALVDSMSAACCLAKGRSSLPGMAAVSRQIGALLLATGVTLSVRWIPSEDNQADGPSRGVLRPSHLPSARDAAPVLAARGGHADVGADRSVKCPGAVVCGGQCRQPEGGSHRRADSADAASDAATGAV